MEWGHLLAPKRAGKTGESSDSRSFFEQDFDRIVFSQPFRKLQDKTQVFPLPEDDFVHTRLTHSLEVSSVGRSLGKMVGSEVVKRHQDLGKLNVMSSDIGSIVGAASLTHDVGNPPFGHTGEAAISQFFKSERGSQYESEVSKPEWSDLVNFEGNAQGYRILTRRSLQLSDPVLGAFVKYPRPSFVKSAIEGRRSQKKFGFFQSESEHFQILADSLGVQKLGDDVWCRHPLAFLVEAADDICYHIIDLEDGCTLGLVSEEELVELLSPILADTFDPVKYQTIATQKERIGTLRALAINTLISQAVGAFLDNEKALLTGDFDQALIDSTDAKPHLDEIIKLSIDRLYRSKMVTEIEVAGFEVLAELLAVFSSAMIAVARGDDAPHVRTVYRLVPEDHRSTEVEPSTYAVLRNCLDFISGMTDSYAVSTYKKLKGISLFTR